VNPNTFAISDWKQSEQTADFWLISLTLTSPSLFDIGTIFWLDSNPEPLRLFNQALQSNSIKLQLLSRAPITKTIDPSQINCSPPRTATTAIPASGNLLILGSGLEMATLFYIAKQRQPSHATGKTLALLHSELGFPFTVKPARFILPGMPAEAIGACPLLEDWKIGNRLASDSGLPGCFEGSLAELLDQWVQYHQAETKPESWQVIGCLPNKMQKKCLEICQSTDWLNFTGITYDN
jgi:dihydroorotate dehydrogenase electron transfer subunit